MKVLLKRKRERETIAFLAEVLDKMAKNGMIRDDVVEETYWTLKKLLRNKIDENILEAFENIVALRVKLEKDISPEKYLEEAKELLIKAREE